jgi:WD40 repeat protein
VSAWALADVQRRLEGLSSANISVSNVAALEGHADTVTTLARLPDGRMASGSADGTVRLWA